jgi:hypothetical protein
VNCLHFLDEFQVLALDDITDIDDLLARGDGLKRLQTITHAWELGQSKLLGNFHSQR